VSDDREIDRFVFRPGGPVQTERGPFVLYTDHVRIVRELEERLGKPRAIEGPIDAVCPRDGSMIRLEDDLRCKYRSECVEDCVFGIASRR